MIMIITLLPKTEKRWEGKEEKKKENSQTWMYGKAIILVEPKI